MSLRHPLLHRGGEHRVCVVRVMPSHVMSLLWLTLQLHTHTQIYIYMTLYIYIHICCKSLRLQVFVPPLRLSARQAIHGVPRPSESQLMAEYYTEAKVDAVCDAGDAMSRHATGKTQYTCAMHVRYTRRVCDAIDCLTRVRMCHLWLSRHMM